MTLSSHGYPLSGRAFCWRLVKLALTFALLSLGAGPMLMAIMGPDAPGGSSLWRLLVFCSGVVLVLFAISYWLYQTFRLLRWNFRLLNQLDALKQHIRFNLALLIATSLTLLSGVLSYRRGDIADIAMMGLTYICYGLLSIGLAGLAWWAIQRFYASR